MQTPLREEIAADFSRLTGLSSAEAAQRLLRDGPNVLPAKRPPPLWRLLAAQLVHFFAVMLWVAGGLAILAGMSQLGIAIFVVIIINGLFAFFQEHRAERASGKLRDLLPRRALVLRDGAPLEIDAADIVVEDVVLLSAGDRISADLYLTEVHGLAIDTSTLTGESVPFAPQVSEQAFAGTFVIEGEGSGVVTATGMETRLAAVARLTQTGHRPPSPLAKELERVVRIIAFVSCGVGIVFLIVAALVGIRLTDAFLFAIGVTVALVPEGLLPTVTLSLAMGAQRMAAHRALVRRLESVETLGSTTFICTDKTGTLTQNEMEVVEAWTPAGRARVEGSGYAPSAKITADTSVLPALRELALVAVRCSNGRILERGGRWVAQGNPLEAALDAFARRLGIDLAADEKLKPVGRRFPFDPRRRRMSVVVGDQLLVKGAPEAVLARCAEPIEVSPVLAEMAGRGLRVIAVAVRSAPELSGSDSAEDVETGLHLLGLIGIEDPPRPEAAEAIAACRKRGSAWRW